jgi:hypothetical protein
MHTSTINRKDALLIDFYFTSEPKLIIINVGHPLFPYKFGRGRKMNDRLADQIAGLYIKYKQYHGIIKPDLTWEEYTKYQQLYTAEILARGQ